MKIYPAFRIQLHSDWFVSMLFNRFFRLTEYTDFNDVILEASIIWESLVTDERKGIGFQLRIKIAWFLANNVEDRRLISKIIKILYNIRSEILHNGGKKVTKMAKKIGGAPQAALISRELTRLLLLRILILKTNTLEIISRSELIKKLDNLLYGEKISLTNSIYFNEAAPKILADIKKKFNHSLL